MLYCEVHSSQGPSIKGATFTCLHMRKWNAGLVEVFWVVHIFLGVVNIHNVKWMGLRNKNITRVWPWITKTLGKSCSEGFHKWSIDYLICEQPPSEFKRNLYRQMTWSDIFSPSKIMFQIMIKEVHLFRLSRVSLNDNALDSVLGVWLLPH